MNIRYETNPTKFYYNADIFIDNKWAAGHTFDDESDAEYWAQGFIRGIQFLLAQQGGKNVNDFI